MTLQRVLPKRSYDSWSEMRSLQEEVNRLFDFDGSSVDVIEGEDQVQVLCELPGIDLKDLEVTVTGNVLTIKGEKKPSQKPKDPLSSGYRRGRSGEYRNERRGRKPDPWDSGGPKAPEDQGS